MKTRKPDIQSFIILHSISKKEFEVLDIGFEKSLYNNLIEEFGVLNSKENKTQDDENKLKSLCNNLGYIEELMDMAANDLDDPYGEISIDLHAQLWEKNPKENFYCIKINIWYKWTKDYFGECDVEVDFDYSITTLKDIWPYMDLYQKNEKLYYIDYEDSGQSYTIESVSFIFNNKFQKTGFWYTIHADKLSIATGYFPIFDGCIDSNNEKDKFFASPELAHNAYCKFKEKHK